MHERRQSAREMTDEIDRMTDRLREHGVQTGPTRDGIEVRDVTGVMLDAIDAPRGTEGRFQPQTGVSQEQMREMGARWLQREAIFSQKAAEDLEDIEARVDDPGEFVGEASKLQQEERQAADTREWQLEEGIGLKFETKIVEKSEKERGKLAERTAAEFMRQKNPKVSELWRAYREQQDEALRALDPPRTIGGGN